MHGNAAELGRSTFSFAWILAALVVVLLGLVVLYMRQGPQGTPEAGGEAAVVQTPVTPDAEQRGENAVEQNSQSEAAATQIVAELKRFQDATERGMDYDQYDKELNSLKTDLNTRLPSFVRHDPSDESFRQEVAAALRDYLHGLAVHINLIPFNPIKEAPELLPTPEERRRAFAEALKAAGFPVTLRYSLGADIAAACGQLARQKN